MLYFICFLTQTSWLCAGSTTDTSLRHDGPCSGCASHLSLDVAADLFDQAAYMENSVCLVQHTPNSLNPTGNGKCGRPQTPRLTELPRNTKTSTAVRKSWLDLSARRERNIGEPPCCPKQARRGQVWRSCFISERGYLEKTARVGKLQSLTQEILTY